MRILHITASYKPALIYGGPIYSIASLAEYCQVYGHEIAVYTTKANGAMELNVDTNVAKSIEGVNVFYFSRWTGDHTHFSPGLLWKLWKTCRQYDVVHIHSWWNTVSVLSLLICLLRSVTPVLSLRGTLSAHTFQHRHTSIKSVFHRWLGQVWLRKAFIHATSEKEGHEASLAVPNGRIEVIPNLIDLKVKEIQETERPSRSLRILFLGRIHPVKNIELILHVLEGFDAASPIFLDIVGEGEDTYIGELKKRFERLSNVQWHGDVRGENKIQMLDEADVLVLLSYTENFGNVILEALSRGTSVIVSDHVGLQDYVRKHQLGWVVSHSEKELSEILYELMGDRSSLNRIRKVAPAIIMRDFGPDRLIRQYESLYHTVSHFKSI